MFLDVRIVGNDVDFVDNIYREMDKVELLKADLHNLAVYNLYYFIITIAMKRSIHIVFNVIYKQT